MPRRRPRSTTFDDPTLRRLLGGDFVSRLTETANDRAPLRIGKTLYSTHDLATKLGVVHTRAARNVSAAAAAIGATSVADFYKRSSPTTFARVGGFGETTLYVLWRVFETHGLDADAWATQETPRDALVSFRALKNRASKEKE